MKKLLCRTGLVLVFAIPAGCESANHPQALGQPQTAVQLASATTQPAGGQVASLDTHAGLSDVMSGPDSQAASQALALRQSAFNDICAGDFTKGTSLLEQSADILKDSNSRDMAHWTREYQKESQSFSEQRAKQSDQAVTAVHALLAHKMDSFASDEMEVAYLLANDKDVFEKQKWVHEEVDETAKMASKCLDSQQWVRALRLYSDLVAVEPADRQWKEDMHQAARGARLLMIYAPQSFKKMEDSEGKDRLAADVVLRALLPVEARKAVTPTTQPDDADSGEAAIDWHEVTHGISYPMLAEAVQLADQEYYRDVNYPTLLKGGLIGLRALATTDGLQETFPGLADESKRKQFLAAVDACDQAADTATPDNAQDMMVDSMRNLLAIDQNTINVPEAVFVNEFADGMFSKLDPFSSMIWPYDTPEFNKMTQGEFGGVGIQIRLDDNGNLCVVSPLEDTPAFRAGIRADDVITKIDGKSAKWVTADHAVKLITGVAGTIVRLTLRSPDGTVHEYSLKREVIKVPSVKGYRQKTGGGWDYMVDTQNDIADIRVTNFSKSTSSDLDKALTDLQEQGVRGIILDLRDNPGGLLNSATEVSNKFLADGVIVSTHANRPTSNPPTEADARPEDQRTDLPLVVLVNHYSASASEIVSGALKDQKRALIVGERTFGKGSVQMLYPLGTHQAYLRLTTSHYYLPSGRCIHREEDSTTWGVDPDLTVELTPQQTYAVDEVRNQFDILHDGTEKPATQPSTMANSPQDLLKADPQLAAGVLLLRLQLAGLKP